MRKNLLTFGVFLLIRLGIRSCFGKNDPGELAEFLHWTIPAFVVFGFITMNSSQSRSLPISALLSMSSLLVCSLVLSRVCDSNVQFWVNSMLGSMIWTINLEQIQGFIVAAHVAGGKHTNTFSQDNMDLIERAWIDQIPMLAWATDPEGNLRYANKYLTNMYKRESLLGMHMKEFAVNSDVTKEWEEHNRKILETGEVIHAFEHGKDGSGNLYCTYALKFLLSLPNGTSLVAGAGLGADSLDSVIRKLQEISDRYELAAEAGQIGVWELFFPSLKCYWNSVLPTIYEKELRSNGFETWLESVHTEDRERVIRTSEGLFKGTIEDKEMEFRIITVSGKIKHIKAFWMPKRRNGELTSVLGVNIDITASKEQEERSIIEKEKAQQANQAKSHFLASMSHEIRTPLNGILGFTQILKETALSPEQEEYLGTISTCGKTLLVILNDILDFSRIEAGMMPMEYVNYNVRKLLESSIKLFQAKASEKSLVLRLEVDKDIPRFLLLETTRVSQLLNNLISNAVKFTEAGEVVVKVSRFFDKSDDRQKLSIAVSDSGIGISEEGVKNLFKPFSQADQSICRRFGGSGLGLAICHRLCTLMHGSLQVRSTLGVGSTFTAFISADSGDTLESPVLSTEVEDGEESECKEFCRILVGEDNPVNQKIFAHIITSTKQKCIIAGTGKKVVEMFAKDGPFDVILMDLQMPEMGGIEATKAIRLIEYERKSKSVPIIAVTADALSTTMKECLDAGMNGYLTKPIQVTDVKKCILKHISTIQCA